MVQRCRSWFGLLLAAVTVFAWTPDLSAQQDEEGGANADGLLLLVTEKIDGPEADEPRVNYWWSNPDDPQWTATDRALKEALSETDAGAMTPPGDVRISRIYRTAELSLDNAASLASILGARRIVLGEVTYAPTTTSILPGYAGLRVEGVLQVVDVAGSEPSVVRSFEVERSVFGAGERTDGPSDRSEEAPRQDGTAEGETAGEPSPVASRARQRFSEVVGGLLDRTVLAASGKIGIESDEPLLAFQNLDRGRALEIVREFLAGLDTVDGTQVRWASEGRVAVEINPSGADDVDAVRYAARTLVEQSFERMAVRRLNDAEKDASRIALEVELDDNFDEPRRRDGDQRDDE